MQLAQELSVVELSSITGGAALQNIRNVGAKGALAGAALGCGTGAALGLPGGSVTAGAGCLAGGIAGYVAGGIGGLAAGTVIESVKTTFGR
jgi:hypothetical protein